MDNGDKVFVGACVTQVLIAIIMLAIMLGGTYYLITYVQDVVHNSCEYEATLVQATDYKVDKGLSCLLYVDGMWLKPEDAKLLGGN